MDTLLWITSTAVMAGLLVLLAVRAARELLGWEPALPTGKTLPMPVQFLLPLAVLWLGSFLAYTSVHGGPDGFFDSFFRRMTEAGDGPHYLFIAENGYVSSGDEVNNIVFYPLYPFLIGLLGKLLGGHTALAGVILSQVCFGASSVMLYRLAERECAHPGCALAAYALYPFGFFCLGLFTEGLFLLLSISGLYFIRERKWLAAGAAGLLCALCRTQGILLLLPGIYCALRDIREDGWSWRRLCALTPLMGFGIYLLINRIVCGDAFAYRYYESIEPWWQTAQWLGDTVVQQRRMALEYPGLASWIYWPQLALYFIAAALLFAGWRRELDTPYLLYGTAYLGMCYTASWLISGGRYMLGCIPLFLCAGRFRTRAARLALLGAEAVFFAVFYVYYYQGQAIM